MAFDDEAIPTVLTSNDSKLEIDIKTEIKEENISNTTQEMTKVNTSSCICSTVSPLKFKIKKKRLRKTKPKSIESMSVLNKVKRISHKAKSNFLNNFDLDFESSQTKKGSEMYISNFDIFQLRSSGNLSENSTCKLANIFQTNTANYSKLLPWEKSSNPKSNLFGGVLINERDFV
jgi:hypothetical protein